MWKWIGAMVLLVSGPAWAQEVDAKQAEEALAKFRAEYKGAASDRAAAVTALAQVQHEKTLFKLGNILMGDPDPSVRVAAARAIGTWKENKSKAAAVLVNALGPNANDPEVRVEIFKALGALEDPLPLDAVHRAFKEKDAKVAKAAIECAGEIRNRSSIPVLIDYLDDMERRTHTGGSGGGSVAGLHIPGGGGDDPQTKRAKELVPALQKALQTITLERYTDPKDWETWWKRNEATFKVPPKPPEPPSSNKKKKK